MAFSSISSGELLISSIAGYVSNASSQAIRVCGNSSNFPAFALGGKTTSQQIQFYTNGTCFSVFDISGLYIQDAKSVSFGTASNNITFTHSGTTSSISFDSLTITPNANSINAMIMTSTGITMNKLTVPLIIYGTNTITITGTGSTISSCTVPLIVNGNITLQASMVATLFTTIYNSQTKITAGSTCNSDIGTPASGSICTGSNPCINNKCGKKIDGLTCSDSSECIGGYCTGGICYSGPPTNCYSSYYFVKETKCKCGSIITEGCNIVPATNGGINNCGTTCSGRDVDNNCFYNNQECLP